MHALVQSLAYDMFFWSQRELTEGRVRKCNSIEQEHNFNAPGITRCKIIYIVKQIKFCAATPKIGSPNPSEVSTVVCFAEVHPFMSRNQTCKAWTRVRADVSVGARVL